MGKMSEIHREKQEQDMFNWIRDRLSDPEADESTSGWQDMVKEWQDFNDNEVLELFEVDEDYWLNSHTYNDLHKSFRSRLEQLRISINSSDGIFVDKVIQYKMTYAYAVTLMESFLSDTVRSLILSNDEYLYNALEKVEDIKGEKVKLIDVYRNASGVKGLVLEILSGVTYHNIPKVTKIISSILDRKINTDMKGVIEISKLRHDIVHRDGKNTQGKSINIDLEKLNSAIISINDFVETIAKEVSSSEARFDKKFKAASLQSDALLNSIKGLMYNTQPLSDLNIEDGAKIIGKSQQTLRRRLFDRGTSWQEIKDDIRIEKALTALKDESKSLKDIAILAGYSGQPTFQRAFKKRYGKTPNEVRNEMRADSNSL